MKPGRLAPQPRAWPTTCSQALFIVLALLCASRGRAAGSSEPPVAWPDIFFDAAVAQADGGQGAPDRVEGTLEVSNWHPSGGACLYLPYADPYYGEDRGTSRRFEMLSPGSTLPVFLGGQAQVTAQAPWSLTPTGLPQLVRLDRLPGAEGAISLHFSSSVPRLPMSGQSEWFYDGFLPQLLQECPKPGQDPEYYRAGLAAHLHGQLHLPSGWSYAGPGREQAARVIAIDQTSRGIAFALSEGDQSFRRKEFQAGGVPVTLLYHSDGFLELEATVSETLPVMVDLLGPFPYPTLTIVETGELQRHGLPGVIAMNRPAQALFHKVQRSLLNWQHWIFSIQLAHQWYGGAITAATPDDDWLVAGLSEFATLEVLSRHPARFNLFNTSARLFSFDYLQISELSAALLRRNAPLAVLTKADLSSSDPAAVQPSLLFIKQAFALRQLKSLAGEQAFFRFTRSLTSHYLYRFLRPSDFAGFFHHLPSPFAPALREELTSYLTNWWTASGWPDFGLERAETTSLPDGRFITELQASQQGGIDFPPLLGVKDAVGHLYMARAAKPKGDPLGLWTASVVTPEEPAGGEADPSHETFDADRFNNRLGWPEVTFFPGRADTLRDDAYTILWVPYAFRRPAEPFSIGLQAALFRYINGGLVLRTETAPGTSLTAVTLSDSFRLPSYALNGGVDASQNYDKDRLAQVSLGRSPVFPGSPAFSVNLALRRRERASEPHTAHNTFGVSLSLKPVGVQRLCGYDLGTQYEKAPGAFAKGFQYDRRQATLGGYCNLSTRVSASLRLFRGLVTGDGTLPQVSLFKPTDLKEAHLRLDQAGLTWARAIESMSLDLSLPFYLPLPSDSLLLTRQMRWRLFYDAGRAIDLGTSYHSAGLGFLLPFGGDLSGAGSLSLTRLSLLVIGYSEAAGLVSRKPSVLLDLSGDL